MKKTWLAGGFVLAAAAVGCGDATVTPPSGSTGAGGDAVISGTLCNDPNMPNGAKVQPGLGIAPDGAFGFSPFPPSLGATSITQAVPPPAISGGTLRVMADGKTAVAADPDRDRVYVVDLAGRAVRATINLAAGDEPGRVVGDALGRAHVALRRGGAIVSIDAATGTVIGRRSVCAAPRGMAYDRGTDLLHVACSDGQLISLPAGGGGAVRTLTLQQDLRDVVVDGPRLRVSRFRSAEVLTIAADGSVGDHIAPPAFRATMARGGQLYTAGVAWKMEEMPNGGGVMILHQRGVTDQVQPVVGGYGGPDACNSIIHPAVTSVSPDGVIKSGPALAGLVMAVDMAVSHDGQRVAMVSSGNATNTTNGKGDVSSGAAPDLTRVFVSTVDATTDDTIGCSPDGNHGPCPAGSSRGILLQTGPVPPPDGTAGTAGGTMAGTGTGGGTGSGDFVPPPGDNCSGGDPSVPMVVAMEPIAVAFDGNDNVIVQSREPAMLAFRDGRGGETRTIQLSTESRFDTGHLVFHANAGGFLACASCHAEGNDDGRIWDFTCQGTRRTQSLQVGLRGTEPFHWAGDETNFSKLMLDVFQGRMSGPQLNADQGDRLLTWIDTQPRPLRTAPSDLGAVERGKHIFNSPQAACATCHQGERFTNAMTVDVGTGGAFQVPSLIGIGTRGPFMHNGCAKTLASRFTNTACGGGDKHGMTSGLSDNQIQDLVAFLNAI